MAATCRSAATTTWAPQPTTMPPPLVLLLNRRAAKPRPLAPPPSSLGRSGSSSFKGGSGASSFATTPKKPAAPAPAETTSASTANPRSGASAFSASGAGRSGASSFGGPATTTTTAAAAAAAAAPPSSSPSTSSSSSSLLKALPTALTVSRVLAIPFFVRLWLFCPSPSAPLWCALLFAASCFTDWLDGFLARALDASTPFGAFLDPVADKLTVAAALVLLCTRAPVAPSPLAGAELAWVVPFSSIAIIGREIFMSALREWAASLGPEARASVSVGGLGKIKTAAQMTAITLLLLTRDGGASAAAVGLSAGTFEAAARLGPPLLVVATVLTKWSLWQYLRAMWPWMSGKKQGVVVVA